MCVLVLVVVIVVVLVIIVVVVLFELLLVVLVMVVEFLILVLVIVIVVVVVVVVVQVLIVVEAPNTSADTCEGNAVYHEGNRNDLIMNRQNQQDTMLASRRCCMDIVRGLLREIGNAVTATTKQ